VAIIRIRLEISQRARAPSDDWNAGALRSASVQAFAAAGNSAGDHESTLFGASPTSINLPSSLERICAAAQLFHSSRSFAEAGFRGLFDG
jgi:hypothetical protein